MADPQLIDEAYVLQAARLAGIEVAADTVGPLACSVEVLAAAYDAMQGFATACWPTPWFPPHGTCGRSASGAGITGNC
jgi:hypothetical protein